MEPIFWFILCNEENSDIFMSRGEITNKNHWVHKDEKKPLKKGWGEDMEKIMKILIQQVTNWSKEIHFIK